jgi:signal transduction histidine kinase/ActR/RegA family two-component response regulator
MFWKAIVLPFLLITLAAAGLGWQVTRMVEDARMVDETDRTIARANELSKLLAEEDVGLRGYLFAGEPSVLAPYQKAKQAAALNELDRLVADDADERAWMISLRQLYGRWSEAAAEAMAAPGPAREIPALRARRALMEDLRALTDRLIAREEQQRTIRMDASRRATGLTLWSAGALVGCFLVVTWTLSRRQVYTISALVAREQEARAAAERALHAKDEFLCTLSHELRTPLTPILGWVSMLRSKQLDGATVGRALEVIERNTRVEIQIVEDVLDVSRSISGKLTVTPRLMDLVSVVQDAGEALRFAAAGKGLTVEVTSQTAALTMVGDPIRLRQVAWNLIGNAVKFTPPGGRIRVHVDLIESSARIRVTDSGQGLAEDALPHLFERFWQAEAGPKRAHGGLGLGLAICKQLVEAHGGTITAASEGAGRGATFTVVLPVMAVVPADLAPGLERVEAPPAAPDVALLRLDGIRVLIVDDEPSSLEVLAEVLRAHGAEVHEAKSGPRALRVLASTEVDVVVSDIAMPGMDGYELIGKIRASPEARRRRVATMALSAYAAPSDVARALGSGFQKHLAKPVSPDHLVGAVLALARGGAPPS